MNLSSKIFLSGHQGMVGSAIHRNMILAGYTNIIVRTSKELDLRRQTDVETFFMNERPEIVIIAAAKVGGIYANNSYPAEFIYNNLMIEANLIHSSYKFGVEKLLFLGSSCIYPRMSPQPIQEEYLLTGTLEATNEAYAIAKISGIELCKFYRRQYGCNFIAAMPTNLYGINDNFDLSTSHVLPALIRKFHEAKVNGATEVTLWGTGTPLREFLYVDDLAEACVFLLDHYNGELHVNVGTGVDLSINELAMTIKKIVGFEGSISYDSSKPDGTPRKVLDVTKIHELGWRHKVDLKEGISRVYEWYLRSL